MWNNFKINDIENIQIVSLKPKIAIAVKTERAHRMKSIFKFLLVLNFVFLLPEAFAADTAAILPPAKTTFFDQNGKPLSAGTVDYYIPGTTTRKMTWQDAAETIPNANPVKLDAAGRSLVLGSGAYRQVVKDKNDNLIWDQVTSSAGSGGGGGGSVTIGDGTAVGTIMAWSGLTAPLNYQFAYGQELSRVNFPALLTALTITQPVFCTAANATLSGIGDTSQIPINAPIESSCLPAGSRVISKTASTIVASNVASVTVNTTFTTFPWGNGNAATTFNAPDMRGVGLIGRNNMGGTATSRVTSTYYGIDPNATGAVGGSQSKVITTLNLPPYSPSGSIAIIDPGHTHGYLKPTVFSTNSGPGASPTGLVVAGDQTVLAHTGISAGFTGTPQGGIADPISAMGPSVTVNYIVKVTPDTITPVSSVVVSIGGMNGELNCGSGITCAANTISAAAPIIPTPTPTTLGGVFSFTCGSGNWVSSLNSSGAFVCTKPSIFDISGVGTMATQNANAVNITGGSIAGASVSSASVNLTGGSINGVGVTGLVTPTSGTDAANKNYVDAIATGRPPLAPIRVTTNAALSNTPTYANGSAGVGATLTAASNGVLTIDSVAVALNDRVLINDEASQLSNGVYTVTTLGTASVPYVLTRSTDFDTSTEMVVGTTVYATAGSTFAGAQFSLSTTTATVGTTPVKFFQSSGYNPGVLSLGSTAGAIGLTNLTMVGSNLTAPWVISGSNLSYSAGKVAVGSSSTPYPLGVKQTAPDADAANFITNSSKTIAGYTSGISLQNLDSTIGNYSSLTNLDSAGIVNSGIRFYNTDHTTPKGSIGIWTRNASSYTDRVNITENGLVGIGTNAPTSTLDVNGNLRLRGYSFTFWGSLGVNYAGDVLNTGGLAEVILAQADPSGVTASDAAFDSACSTGRGVHVPAGTYTFASNHTWTACKNWTFDQGAILKPNSGVTLTISGQVNADSYQIFDHSAGGIVTGIAGVRPEWWGAARNCSTDDQPAIQAAQNSMNNGANSISLPIGMLLSNGCYAAGSTITATVLTYSKLIWSGVGSADGGAGTSIKSLPSFSGREVIKFVPPASGVRQSGIDLRGFSVSPISNGAGASVGILIGGSTTNTLQGGLKDSAIEDIDILQFAIGMEIVNARLLQFSRIAIWNNALANSTCLSIHDNLAPDGATGELNFYDVQLVGYNDATGISLDISSTVLYGTYGIGVSSVKFNSLIAYYGKINITATNGGRVSNVYFLAGTQIDSGYSSGITLAAVGSGSQIYDFNVKDSVVQGNSTASYGNVVNAFTISSGQIYQVRLENSSFGGSFYAETLALSGVDSLFINDNLFTFAGNPGGPIVRVQGGKGIQINGNSYDKINNPGTSKYFIAADIGANYLSIRNNLSMGIPTNGIGLNDNIFLGSVGSQKIVDGNW